MTLSAMLALLEHIMNEWAGPWFSNQGRPHQVSKEAAHDERTHKHACNFARAHRADRGVDLRNRAQPRRARPCRGRHGVVWRVGDRGRARSVCRRPSERGRDRFHRGALSAHLGTAAAGVGAAGFLRSRSGYPFDERAFRARSRPALSGHGACIRCRKRAAGGGRRARLRCAGRRSAGNLGAGEGARSGRKPQADTGRAGLRGHRIAAADCGCAFALHRRDKMDRARGAFAAAVAVGRFIACGGLGLTMLRRRANSQPSWPDRPMDHGMEMR